MNLRDIVSHSKDKTQFNTLENYFTFCSRYLDFVETGLQARIVSQNESHYQFFQYKEDGNFNITWPLNSRLMLNAISFSGVIAQFNSICKNIKEGKQPSDDLRDMFVKVIYTIQQSIGASLDALPSGMSNQARKVNGDLFERLIRLLIVEMGVDCVSGTMQVPVNDEAGNLLFKSSYQHDLLISKDSELKIIGSVKTSSKDRIDKIFMDKFLYSKLTETELPHIAIFLNDVQRKQTKGINEYGTSATFLPGHFRAYTVKLNSLDGVYYCDIRPNMVVDTFLSRHIKTIDHFFFTDLFGMLDREGKDLDEVAVKPDKNETLPAEITNNSSPA